MDRWAKMYDGQILYNKTHYGLEESKTQQSNILYKHTIACQFWALRYGVKILLLWESKAFCSKICFLKLWVEGLIYQKIFSEYACKHIPLRVRMTSKHVVPVRYFICHMYIVLLRMCIIKVCPILFSGPDNFWTSNSTPARYTHIEFTSLSYTIKYHHYTPKQFNFWKIQLLYRNNSTQFSLVFVAFRGGPHPVQQWRQMEKTMIIYNAIGTAFLPWSWTNTQEHAVLQWQQLKKHPSTPSLNVSPQSFQQAQKRLL